MSGGEEEAKARYVLQGRGNVYSSFVSIFFLRRLFNNAFCIETVQRRMVDAKRMSVNWKEFRINRSWPTRNTIPTYVWRD
jgi:hypothetical protein